MLGVFGMLLLIVREKKNKRKIVECPNRQNRTSPLEPGMINLKTCKDSEKSNITFDINDSNGNAILPEMN